MYGFRQLAEFLPRRQNRPFGVIVPGFVQMDIPWFATDDEAIKMK